MFFDNLNRFKNRTALIDSDTNEAVSYEMLHEKTLSFQKKMLSKISSDTQTAQKPTLEKPLVFIAMDHSIDLVIYYLACLNARWPVFLCDTDIKGKVQALIELYNPNYLIRPGASITIRHTQQLKLHPKLSLLLSTSGSTGTPKLVQLSERNIDSNAKSIAQYLSLTEKEKALGHLKLHYSYGLSILHSHLTVGASITLTTHTVIDDAFWKIITDYGITSFAGVPYTFDSIDKKKITLSHYPSLRYLTQAGGKLPPIDVSRWVEKCSASNIEFFVMYGQTEAAPRIAYLPPELASSHPNSIGKAIPGGEIKLRNTDGKSILTPETAGELVYKGPNVMMGYATTPSDLANPKQQQELLTGDIATFNNNGLFTIIGRSSRFIKPYGIRVNLEEIQTKMQSHFPGSVCTGTDTAIFVAHLEEQNVSDFIQQYSQTSNLPISLFKSLAFTKIPRLSSGKVDFKKIKEIFNDTFPSNILEETYTQKLSLIDSVKILFTPYFWHNFRTEFLAITGISKKSKTIEEIFQQVLRLPQLDPRLNFKNLGGDSLSYVAMTIELEQHFGFLPESWENLTINQLNALTINNNTII